VLEKGEPKYLNSPETPIFEKGRELYGLTQAMKAIRASGKVIVVEGYMDVVALAQHGVEYAVATLGTATSASHIQRLLRLTDHIVFCFDGDAAGRRAAWRALEISLPLVTDGKEIGFLFLPQEHDPDSYIRHYGREKFEEALTNSIPLSSYLTAELQQAQDMRKEEGRAAMLQRAKPLLMQIVAPLLSLMLRKRFAEIAGIAREELDALLGIKPLLHASRAKQKIQIRDTSLAIPLRLAAQIMAQPSLARDCDLNLHESIDPEAVFLRNIIEFCQNHPDLTSAGQIELGVTDLVAKPLLDKTLRFLASEEWEFSWSPEQIEVVFQDGLAKMKKELEKKFTEARYRTAKSTAELKITAAPRAK
jgi:DNA primase